MASIRMVLKSAWPPLLVALIWIGVASGWSWGLISTAFDHTINAQLTADTQRLGTELREKLLLPTGADEAIHETLLRACRTNPALSYLMIWENGSIVYHSDPGQEHGNLNVEAWPSFSPADSDPVRISHIKSLPWDAAAEPVVDATLQIKMTTDEVAHVYYLSAGYKQVWVNRQFWATQGSQIVLAATFILLGLIVLLLALSTATRRLERTRAQQAQSVLARTSLLTERGMLASVLAHEVRSPLTALRFNLHALRNLIVTKSPKVERQVELTDSCDREIRRLDLMLSDFLTRTQVVNPAELTSVNRVVNEAIEFLRPALEQRNIRITTHFDASDPAVVINAAELRQVLLNLCTNAQEAMRTGGTLAVSTLSEQDNVSLLVRDSGGGIPLELQQRIFEPFFSTKPQGSGLGLALVRRVISGAGGKVFCESIPGKGTTFRVVLPRGTAIAEPAATTHIAPDTQESMPSTTPSDPPTRSAQATIDEDPDTRTERETPAGA